VADAAVHVGGRALWAQRWGDGGGGVPLLLLPGMATHSGYWPEAFLRALEPAVAPVLLDHRGSGGSARDGEPFAVADLARDALGALDALGVQRAGVLGFSLGGMVAQELALAAPERVVALVLVGTSPGGPQAAGVQGSALDPLLDAMRAHDGERAIRAGWEANVGPALAGDEAAFARWVATTTERPFPLPTLRAQRAAAGEHDAAARLRALAGVPTVVVHGTEDRLVPAADGTLLAELVPGAGLELVEGAGHLVFWEQPEHVAGLVREVLA
jgi:pimeloyl-ACP methyl ester carboxylesterase